jgi:hypothetical protein
MIYYPLNWYHYAVRWGAGLNRHESVDNFVVSSWQHLEKQSCRRTTKGYKSEWRSSFLSQFNHWDFSHGYPPVFNPIRAWLYIEDLCGSLGFWLVAGRESREREKEDTKIRHVRVLIMFYISITNRCLCVHKHCTHWLHKDDNITQQIYSQYEGHYMHWTCLRAHRHHWTLFISVAEGIYSVCMQYIMWYFYCVSLHRNIHAVRPIIYKLLYSCSGFQFPTCAYSYLQHKVKSTDSSRVGSSDADVHGVIILDRRNHTLDELQEYEEVRLNDRDSPRLVERFNDA